MKMALQDYEHFLAHESSFSNPRARLRGCESNHHNAYDSYHQFRGVERESSEKPGIGIMIPRASIKRLPNEVRDTGEFHVEGTLGACTRQVGRYH